MFRLVIVLLMAVLLAQSGHGRDNACAGMEPRMHAHSVVAAADCCCEEVIVCACKAEAGQPESSALPATSGAEAPMPILIAQRTLMYAAEQAAPRAREGAAAQSMGQGARRTVLLCTFRI